MEDKPKPSLHFASGPDQPLTHIAELMQYHHEDLKDAVYTPPTYAELPESAPQEEKDLWERMHKLATEVNLTGGVQSDKYPELEALKRQHLEMMTDRRERERDTPS